MKKLYEVEVTLSMFVVAESEEAAEDYVSDNEHEWKDNAPSVSTSRPSVLDEDTSPSFPYSAEGDFIDEEKKLTCADWLKRIEEEEATEKAKADLEAWQGKLELKK